MSTATLAMLLSLPLVCLAAAEAPPNPPIRFETESLRYSLTADGKAAEFTDKRTGKNYAVATPFAMLRQGKQTFPSTGCSLPTGS